MAAAATGHVDDLVGYLPVRTQPFANGGCGGHERPMAIE